MVLAHLMSIQIDDGGPGDAFHSLKQELKDEWENIVFFSEDNTFTVYIPEGSQSKTFTFDMKIHLT